MVIDDLEKCFFSYSNIDLIADKIIEAITNGMFHFSMKEKMDTLEQEKSSYQPKIAKLQLKQRSYYYIFRKQ